MYFAWNFARGHCARNRVHVRNMIPYLLLIVDYFCTFATIFKVLLKAFSVILYPNVYFTKYCIFFTSRAVNARLIFNAWCSLTITSCIFCSFRTKKILNLKLFDGDDDKRWAKSVMDKEFEVLCVSQVIRCMSCVYHSVFKNQDVACN